MNLIFPFIQLILYGLSFLLIPRTGAFWVSWHEDSLPKKVETGNVYADMKANHARDQLEVYYYGKGCKMGIFVMIVADILIAYKLPELWYGPSFHFISD